MLTCLHRSLRLALRTKDKVANAKFENRDHNDPGPTEKPTNLLPFESKKPDD